MGLGGHVPPLLGGKIVGQIVAFSILPKVAFFDSQAARPHSSGFQQQYDLGRKIIFSSSRSRFDHLEVHWIQNTTRATRVLGRLVPWRKTIEMEYHVDHSPDRTQRFSVIYQINPPSITNAVSVDAIDANGNVLKNLGRFMHDTTRFRDLKHRLPMPLRCG